MTAVVYRAYGASDELLYVGCTSDLQARLRQHKQHSPWFQLMKRYETKSYTDKQAALHAEATAIRTERPIFNASHNRALLADPSAIGAVVPDVEPGSSHSLLNIPQVAEKLRISERSVWRLVAAGELATVQIGKSRRVTPDAVRAYVARQSGSTGNTAA